MKIVHLTNVHPRQDVRIFLKQCCSLSRAGHEVTLIVADGLGNETVEGIRIVDVGRARGGRVARMTLTAARVLRAAVKEAAAVYHFHDPELLSAGIALRLRGHRVIYDAHEDLPRQILAKTYLPRWTRQMISSVAEWIEEGAASFMSGIVAATPLIGRRFAAGQRRVAVICNYPLLQPVCPQATRERTVCYQGALTRARGLLTMVQAMEQVDGQLLLAGRFAEPGLEAQARAQKGWAHVRYLGQLHPQALAQAMSGCRAGLVVLHPERNYVEAIPTKLFEYMAMEMPVIASDFPAWRQWVIDGECGQCVDPQDPTAIARAIQRVFEHPEEAAAMGRNGRRMVEERYNWQTEERALLAFYQELT